MSKEEREESPPIGHVRAHTYIPDACARGGGGGGGGGHAPVPAGRRALGEHLLTGEESLAQLKRGEGGEGKAANREGGGKCSID